jgi:hypothetical protein
MLLAAFVLAAVASGAAADAGDVHVDVAHKQVTITGDNKLLRGDGTEVAPTVFFIDAGRKDLADKVKEAQSSAAWTGVGVGAGVGCGGFLLSWGGAIAAIVVAATSNDPSTVGTLAPVGIGLGFLGFALLATGAIVGAIIAIPPQLSEPWPLSPEEMKAVVDKYNASLAAAAAGDKTAMRY